MDGDSPLNNDVLGLLPGIQAKDAKGDFIAFFAAAFP